MWAHDLQAQTMQACAPPDSVLLQRCLGWCCHAGMDSRDGCCTVHVLVVRLALLSIFVQRYDGKSFRCSTPVGGGYSGRDGLEICLAVNC